MQTQFSRTEQQIGKEAVKKLRTSSVAVFGIGGVGGYVVEALARSGIGMLTIFDNDMIGLTNLNRQIIATHSTIGEYKVDVAKRRILDINPEAQVIANRMFFLPENAEEIEFTRFDYVVDAIDTVTGKIELVMCAKKAGIPIICSMGAGNKLEASMLEVADIYQTSVCPLAKVMRRELKARGIEACKVVYSREQPKRPLPTDEVTNKRQVPASNAFVPAVAGLIMAGEVVKDLCGI